MLDLSLAFATNQYIALQLYHGMNVKPMNMVYLKRRHISTRSNKTQEKMQYPVINMHGPEFDCYSNSNEKCMGSILIEILKKQTSIKDEEI